MTTIYVRKGTTPDERWISFPITSEMDQAEILERGWAIDGNRVLLSATVGTLHQKESDLVAWLHGHGVTDSVFG